MAKSSISKLQKLNGQPQFAASLGTAIRERRIARGLTQTELGHPLTKGFVSEVERGRSLPSLRALALIADRLGVPAGELLGEVKGGLPGVYTASDENEHSSADSSGSRHDLGSHRDPNRDATEAGTSRRKLDPAATGG
jgi:transcriptional regulator with XRE-family HTH domain